MWRGRVNDGAITRGEQTIAYDGGSMQGDFAFADMTKGLMVWFGTSAGSDDLGRRLLLSITGTAASGSMVIDWYDDIELSDDDHITIIHFRPPWPKLSWFSTADGFYKSGPPASESGAGIAYSDQNEEPPPQVVMGRCAVYDAEDATNTDFWWLAGGLISPTNVAGAYQAIGAETQADSYLNLNNPGTNNLGVGVAPSWAAATGWTFNGSTQYLTTGITPTSTYTIAIRYVTLGTGSTRIAAGENALNANFGIGTTDVLGISDNLHARWGDNTGSFFNLFIGEEDRVIVLAGDDLYRDGSKIYDFITTGGAVFTGTPNSIYIGAANDGATPDTLHFNNKILAVAIYDTALSGAEITALTTKMQALTATTTPNLGLSVDASDSQPVATGATISTYAWSYTPSGATASFSSSSSAATYFKPIDVTNYYIKCTVTDSNGKITVGYRPVVVDDGSIGITEFSRTAITEQYNSFNVGCSLTMTSPDVGNTEADNPQVDWSDIKSGVMVIITANDFYGTTEKNISFRGDSRYTDRLNILYCGFVIGEVRNWGSNSASIQLTCGNAVQFFLYSLSLTGVRSSSDWYEMNSDLMYVAALLFHLFKYHSTLLEISDWILPWADTTLRSAVEEWTEGNIMDRARSFAGEHGRLMAITATSQGEFFVEEDANLISEADRNALTTTLTLDNDDIEQTRQVKINHRPMVSQVYVSGGSSDGVLGTFEPFLSISQNVRKAQGVGAQNFERLMLPDQTESNRLCGRILAVLNREKVEVVMTFAGIYREVFSPTDSQWVNTGTEIFAAGEITNLRGSTDLNSIRLIPRQVSKSPPGSGYAGVNVVFDVEAPAGELAGRTITLLPVDPFYVPPAAETGPPLMGEPLDALVTGDNTNGVEVYIFDDATWASRNTGLTGDDLKVRDLKVVPYWWIFQNSTDHEDCMLWIATDGGIFFSNDFGKSWQNRTPLAALDSAPAGVTPETVAYYSIDVFSVATDINRTITAQCREEVAGTIHSWLLISTNSGFNWTSSKRS
jgi:hypothetical protein